MSERDQIHAYLKSLSKYLSRLHKSDAEEVIREIESHIYDALDLQQESGQSSDLASILEGFGEPRQLAAQYVEHILQGAPPPSGFKAIQKVKKGVTHGVYYSMFLFGYGIALALVLTGLGKLFFPESIGVWAATHGNSIIITFAESTYPESEEILGFWLIPLAVITGLGIGWLTRRVLAVLNDKL